MALARLSKFVPLINVPCCHELLVSCVHGRGISDNHRLRWVGLVRPS